jgi:hypothetical protein
MNRADTAQKEPMNGAKTSEFISAWTSTALAGGFGFTDDSPLVRMAAVLAMGFIMGCYALSRGAAKKGGAS